MNWKYHLFLFITITYIVNKAQAQNDSIKTDIFLNMQIDSAFKFDQDDRAKIQHILSKFGIQSKEAQHIFDQTALHDSSNIVAISNILDKYGWPDSSSIGTDRSIAIWAILQHADSAIQEKYFPIMQLAVKQKKLAPRYLALTEDRRLVRQGKPQIYGSQLQIDQQTGKRTFFPIIDPKNINKRRRSVGLDTIEEYAKSLNVPYPNSN
ncbi:DUF6624 domain-containing protein [Rhizosphaericola mali]|uniref:Uncharacterized protein n=1 Tax=Rhizosphaericola mali TaxID=2545455 RepID=A0A5P2G166_9BACT|nr:DUF6624 domain-containing protein [Rhizosphaericola mali]QES87570.1 hypothetical protein E0W69_002435 [Rhizosphaericola mali]